MGRSKKVHYLIEPNLHTAKVMCGCKEAQRRGRSRKQRITKNSSEVTCLRCRILLSTVLKQEKSKENNEPIKVNFQGITGKRGRENGYGILEQIQNARKSHNGNASISKYRQETRTIIGAVQRNHIEV